MSIMKKVLIADKMSVQAEKIFTANGINFDKKINPIFLNSNSNYELGRQKRRYPKNPPNH